MIRQYAVASVAVGLFLVTLPACELRSYELQTDGGGAQTGGNGGGGNTNPFLQDASGTGGSGTTDGGAGNGPTVPDGSVLQPDGRICKIENEVCDGMDNDCDGVIDNGIDLTVDPGNCGACGTVCVVERAFPACVAGKCAVGDCLPGWFNVDGKPENGCECLKTNGGVELCDGSDNDCDGQTDEDFNLTSDPANCGTCGRTCNFPYAATTCTNSMCAMGACEAGRIDQNGRSDDGCEYDCTPSNAGVEICDGVDNDCDGGIDNNPIDQGAACGPDVVNTGVCARGIMTCTSGTLVCLGAIQPGIEVCDGRDNNCDGLTDEGFDKLNDIRYCGSCERCAFDNAVPRCNAGACQIEVCTPGWVNLDMMPGDGCEYSCTFRGQDICNGVDDDCDGETDEGINKATDPRNCGECGRICSYANAAGLCTAGACAIGGCNANFYDIDRNAATGCEYFCVNSGAEVCDGVDNNCNGQVDEGFSTSADINNCGQCGRKCQFNNAGAMCSSGQCQMGGCMAGFTDANNNAADGCEYQCATSNGGVEICDGKDNDCDGVIDETDPHLNKNCFPAGATGCDPVAGTCKGICQLGKFSCLGGQLACQNSQTGRAETCDNIDNDCDGVTDNGFNKATDPRFCGGCSTACTYTNAIALCENSQCKRGPCLTGWTDRDGNPANGCEYNCTTSGPEVCDGKDNDCDGLTDAADSDLLRPNNFCVQFGACAGASPQCQSPSVGQIPDWICNYGADVQLSASNQIIGQESWCDGKDNDCDGAIDEFVPNLGTNCSDDGVGACRRTGTIACAAGNKTAPAACVYTAAATTPANEICDGKDNDCDGVTDEAWDNPTGLTQCSGATCLGVRDATVQVNVSGAPYYIYQYEASRADALAADAGALASRACSKVSALPWTSVTYTEAQAACAAAGMRLCRTNRTNCTDSAITTDEWGTACGYSRVGSETYPYGTTYQAATCNGLGSWTPTSSAALLAAGARTLCKTADLNTDAGEQASFDMSGNASEWTEDCAGTLSDNRRIYTIRGGDYSSDFYNGLTSLRCNFTAVSVPENYKHPSTGFRCCSTCAPGLSECAGACVNFANNSSHCGACGTVCAGGTTCQNGRCR